jgi:hypothetical protein
MVGRAVLCPPPDTNCGAHGVSRPAKIVRFRSMRLVVNAWSDLPTKALGHSAEGFRSLSYYLKLTPYGLGAGVGRGLVVGSGLGVGVGLGVEVGVAVAVAVAVGVGVGVRVAVGVAVAVAVAIAVAVAVAVGVGLGVAVPHGAYSATSSTHCPVVSPGGLNPSWCTRNLIRTVCPAYGVMSTCTLVQSAVSHRW